MKILKPRLDHEFCLISTDFEKALVYKVPLKVKDEFPKNDQSCPIKLTKLTVSKSELKNISGEIYLFVFTIGGGSTLSHPVTGGFYSYDGFIRNLGPGMFRGRRPI